MTDNFYRAFEERYYAPRETIKQLRRQYLPFVKPLVKLYPNASVLDIGCGRGEWLELMLEAGFSPYGVDLDDGMLSACIERGLPAHKGDAISHLTKLSDSSHAVISAFHVVEHISFDQLRVLVSEAMRVLLPGGLLIMETPNPENIIVATRNFYLDPTHQRPIPQQLLSFVVEYAGFNRIKTIRLQESTELARKSAVALHEVLQGVSPDYAVIAQKDAEQSILSSNNEPFEREYGLTIETLTVRHDNTWRTEVQRVEAMVQRLEVQLNAIYTSKSWRITAPLRWAAMQVRRLREQGLKTRLRALAKKLVRPILRRASTLIDQYPELRRTAISVSRKLGLYDLLRRVYRSATGHTMSGPTRAQSVNLSANAEKIYDELKAAIQQRGEAR